MDTIQRLRTDLQSLKGDWPQLCRDTGLSYWWLIKFGQGRIAEPAFSKVERLRRAIDARVSQRAAAPAIAAAIPQPQEAA